MDYVTFVEDPVTRMIHVYLSRWSYELGQSVFERVSCEQLSSNNLDWVKIGERVRDDWFERLCPECFPPEEKDHQADQF
jgi:hypothetical protein